MASEIAEAGAVVRRQLAANAASTPKLAARLRARQPPFVVTIARGSSDHAALYLKHLIELKVALACASLAPSIASLYHAPLRLGDAVAIAISQSGRSPDIVATQSAAKDARAVTIARDAEAVAPLHAGMERSVAATKSMIAALVAGASLVAHWSEDRELLAALAKLPSVLDASSAAPPSAKSVETLAKASSLFVIGRGATLAVAAEAALK